ncbi:FGGY family carbohydrate kinase [Caproiciproducens sp.]
MKRYILVLDEGTTNVRTMIFDRSLNLVASSSSKLELNYPEQNHVEQSAEDIFDKTVSTMRDAVSKGGIDPNDIECVGISTQRVTWTVWKRDTGEPLHPMITWMDRRGISKFEELKQNKEFETRFPEVFHALQPQQNACSISWQLEKDPKFRSAMEDESICFGTVDTWVVYKLTGGKIFASNASNAGTTRLLDNATLTWNAPLLKFLGISEKMFPEVKNEADDYGRLTKDILGVEIPITGVVADQQSALFAQACLTPWSVKSTNGTGSFVTFNLGDACVKGKGPYASIVAWKLPDQVRFMAEGFLPTAGAALEWLMNRMHLIQSFDEINEIMARTPDSGGVYFSPALNGLRAPLNDASARAAFLGISGGTTREQCVRAVVESIGYANAQIIKDVCSNFGIRSLDSIKISGGVARESTLGQMIADITGTKVEQPTSLEASAIGAAEFAGIYTGAYSLKDIPDLLHIEKVFTPDQNTELYCKNYRNWEQAILRTTNWTM